MLAISSDAPERMVASLEVGDLGYELYSDGSMSAARSFGIAFQLSDEEAAGYAEYGIDLAETTGHDDYQLPVPSVFLVEPGGRIAWVYSNPDYTVRPDNAKLLAAARESAPGA